MKRLLKDKRGEGFVDVCVLVLAIAMVLALVVRIAPVFVAKQKITSAAMLPMRMV